MKASFAPVARALGFYGDLVVGDVTTTVARSERGGLADHLAELIDAEGQPRRRGAR